MRILRKKYKKAFSLAEMMVVMLIASVVLAASAPMITKKVQRDQMNSDVFDVLGSDENNAVEFVAGIIMDLESNILYRYDSNGTPINAFR